ncbi:MAG: penicillin-binding protein 2 [Bacteroidota bacterium]
MAYQSERTRTSIRVLQIIILGMCFVVLGRVFYLQIVQNEVYEELGRKNSLRQEIVSPARGLIYDRFGTLIVDNQPIYSITITPSLFQEESTPLLASLLEVEDSVIHQQLKTAKSYSWHRPSRLISDVTFEAFSSIQENLWRLPGVGHQIESKRHYPTPMKAAHILGYLREANERDYAQIPDIRLGDNIGKSGLEMEYEDKLRGRSGVEYLRVNALGQTLGTFEGEQSGLNPEEGNGLITTIDAELQLLAEDLMEGKRGAVVAMEPHTGEILALVSSPGYDLNRLAGRLDRKYWYEINTDSTTPLFNRAISSRQPPGSTFKPIMGIVGLHLGIITPETNIYNPGQFVKGRSYKDTAPIGDYDLKKAITFSSNTYFFALMDRIASQGKLNEWSALIKDFGLGVPNAIDLPSSNRGIIPDSTYMNNAFGYRQWSLGDIINLGIGQGIISSSPLQIAMMTSSIANGGYRIQPHVVKEVIHSDGSSSPVEPAKERIDWVKDEYLDVVKEGMRGVVLEGSGRYYSKFEEIAIAGKTGTAQNPHGIDHGWFTSFAPFEDPEIVVTVFYENAGFASTSASPIAALVIEKYLTREIKRNYVYNYVKTHVPKQDSEEPEE